MLQVLLAGRCPSLAFWHQHSFYLSASHLNSTAQWEPLWGSIHFLYFSQFTSPEELPLEQQQTCLRPPELFPLHDKTTVWLCQQFPMSLSPLSMILWKVNIKMEEWHEVSLNNWWIHWKFYFLFPPKRQKMSEEPTINHWDIQSWSNGI